MNAGEYLNLHAIDGNAYSFRQIKEFIEDGTLEFPIFVSRDDSGNFAMTDEEKQVFFRERSSDIEAKEILERHSWMIINDDKELEEAIEKEEN